MKGQIQWLFDNGSNLFENIVKILKNNFNSSANKITSNIQDLISVIDDINLEDKLFSEIENLIFNEYSDELDENELHSINNLTLLSINENSALKNNIFPIKREKIIEMDKQGHFIPIASKNVFLKYFSPETEDNLKWTKQDREFYFNSLEKILKEFLVHE